MRLIIYRIVTAALLPLVLFRLAWLGFRNPAYWRRWRERFGFVRAASVPTIWVHAVSVGETRAAEPLVRALQHAYPGTPIWISTTTPTGSAQVRQLFGDSVLHSYLPYDLPGANARFLKRVRPRIALIMETELWPNLFHACRQRAIPIAVANLRLSARSFARYRRFAALTRITLSQVTVFAVQAQADAERLISLGAPPTRVQVTGSLKFDLDVPPELAPRAQALRARFGQRPVWIAASTHAGEEEMALHAQRALKAAHPDLLLILVPRHPERFAGVARLVESNGFRYSLRSDSTAALNNVDVLVGDTMGELLLLIATADVAFIGGSLVPVGGHNILEPAAVGVPALVGPHMFNFDDINRRAHAAGCVQTVSDADALAPALTTLLGDTALRARMAAAGRALIETNRGARDKTITLIEEQLR